MKQLLTKQPQIIVNLCFEQFIDSSHMHNKNYFSKNTMIVDGA